MCVPQSGNSMTVELGKLSTRVLNKWHVRRSYDVSSAVTGVVLSTMVNSHSSLTTGIAANLAILKSARRT
jgi:hypothetical protein